MTPSTTGWHKALRALLPPLFWLGVWQGAAWLVELGVEGRGNELLLPYPLTVLRALLELARETEFWASAAASLGRVLIGMAAGTLLAALLSAAAWASAWTRQLFAPAIRVVRATPVASFILLVLLWTDRNFVPAVIAALMVLPVVWENLVRGLDEVDGQLVELGQAYRLSPAKMLTLIYLPSLRPYFLSAVTTAMGLAWKSGVAAEVLCLPRQALGTQIYNTKYYLEVPQLFAWTAAVVVLSLVLERLLRLVLGRWGEGRPSCSK